MLKPFRREGWQQSSDILQYVKNVYTRLPFHLTLCQVFIVGVLKYIVKSIDIGNVPHSINLVWN